MFLNTLLGLLLPLKIQNFPVPLLSPVSLRAGTLFILFQQLFEGISFFEYFPRKFFEMLFLHEDMSGAAFVSTPLPLHVLETKMNQSIFGMTPFQLETIFVILLACTVTMGIIAPIMALCVKDENKTKYLKILIIFSFMIVVGRCMNAAILVYICRWRVDLLDYIFDQYHQSSEMERKLLRLFFPGVLGSFERNEATSRVLLLQFYYGIFLGFTRWYGTNAIFCFCSKLDSENKAKNHISSLST